MITRGLKIVRIIIVLISIVGFIWLTWCVLPDLAFVRFDNPGGRIPATGYVLEGFENRKLYGHRVIKTLDRGWSGVGAAWPYMMLGSLYGVVIGYFAGEQTRRMLAIDEASQAALDKAAKQLRDAKSMAAHARDDFKELDISEKKVASRMAELDKQEVKIIRKQEELEALKTSFEEKLRNIETGANELKKARSKIRRLEEKINRMEEENSIDWP